MDGNCPVCGGDMKRGGGFFLRYAEQPFSFCTMECTRLFRQFPEVYMNPEVTEVQTIEGSDTGLLCGI